jgi:hypothetical protein
MMSNAKLRNQKSKSGINLEDLSEEVHYNSNIFSKLTPDGKFVLTYVGLMTAGAIARSVAQTVMHPLNVIKTMLQTRHGTVPDTWEALSRGAGAQFIMSVPHGALNFAVIEVSDYNATMKTFDRNHQ